MAHLLVLQCSLLPELEPFDLFVCYTHSVRSQTISQRPKQHSSLPKTSLTPKTHTTNYTLISAMAFRVI